MRRRHGIDHIRYDLLTQEALRGVVRTRARRVAKKGLPGEHHFYITFDTRPPACGCPTGCARNIRRR